MRSLAAGIIILVYLGGLLPAAERAKQVHPGNQVAQAVSMFVYPFAVGYIIMHDFMLEHPTHD